MAVDLDVKNDGTHVSPSGRLVMSAVNVGKCMSALRRMSVADFRPEVEISPLL